MKCRNMQEELKKITYDYIVTESEYFSGVAYATLNQDIAILTANNGKLTCNIYDIPNLCRELMEMFEVYGDNQRVMVNPLQKEQERNGRL